MLSIIIVSFNTKDLLRQCLESLRRHCADSRIIVVDNASQDGTVDMVRDDFPEVRLIPLTTNCGFAGANNEGLKVATGDFIVLLNSDTVLEDDSLTRCAAWMAQQPRLGAASPRLIGVDDRPQACLYPFPSLGAKFRQALRREGNNQAVEQTGWLAGTVLFIRKEALEQVGGRLDDRFFMYWEDADFSARLLEAGWEVGQFPDGHVRHYGGASGGGQDERRRPDLHAWYVWGQHRWFAKHRQAWEGICLWLLDFLEVFRQGLRGLIRPNRRHECVHARVVAGVLVRRLLGLAPPSLGPKNKP